MACRGCVNLESEVEGLGRAPEQTHSEDEEQLHKDCSKWKDASDQRRKDRMEVPDLLWDLARDLICPHWVFIRLLTETKVKPSKHQWKRDPKPQAQQCHHGGERHCS